MEETFSKKIGEGFRDIVSKSDYGKNDSYDIEGKRINSNDKMPIIRGIEEPKSKSYRS